MFKAIGEEGESGVPGVQKGSFPFRIDVESLGMFNHDKRGIDDRYTTTFKCGFDGYEEAGCDTDQICTHIYPPRENLVGIIHGY